jgi:hypothetical protein
MNRHHMTLVCGLSCFVAIGIHMVAQKYDFCYRHSYGTTYVDLRSFPDGRSDQLLSWPTPHGAKRTIDRDDWSCFPSKYEHRWQMGRSSPTTRNLVWRDLSLARHLFLIWYLLSVCQKNSVTWSIASMLYWPDQCNDLLTNPPFQTIRRFNFFLDT